MRAIIQNEWDGPDSVRLVEVPEPRPAPTEVKVRVHAAGVNPVDYYTSGGLAYNGVLDLPFIHGWDVSRRGWPWLRHSWPDSAHWPGRWDHGATG